MPEQFIQWPRWTEEAREREELEARLQELLGEPEQQQSRRDDTWVDELLESWPENVPRFIHPGDWRPSVRYAELQSVSRRPWDIFPEDAHKSAIFNMRAHTYREWLRQHSIIDAKPADMVRDVLMDYERGGDRNLAYVAFTIDPPHEVARRFEREYLGLESLPKEVDDVFEVDDDDLRIHEDGLYGPYDFTYRERYGGSLPVDAVAKALKTSPEELIKRLTTDGIDETDEVGNYILPWNMIRLDEFLLMARPHPDDPSQILVGRLNQLTPFGSHLLEEFLRAYDTGTKA